MGNISENGKRLIDVYEKGKLAEFAEVYDAFRKEAVLDYGLYIECEERLQEKADKLNKKEQNKNKLDEIKLGICSTFTYMREVLKKDLEIVENRQDLIDIMGERVSRTYEVLNECAEKKKASVRFLHIHIILDMCFACFQYKGNRYGYISRLHLPAMFYDLLCNWNKEQRENAERKTGTDERYRKKAKEFLEFYGRDAEEEVLNYTCQNVKIFCSQGQDTTKFLTKCKDATDKRYVSEFVDKLSVRMNTTEAKEQEQKNSGSESNFEKRQEQSRRKEQPDSVKEKRGEKHRETENWFDKKEEMSSDRYERNYIKDRLEPQNLSVTEKDVNRDKHKKTEDIEERKKTLNRALIITFAIVAAVILIFMMVLIISVRGNNRNRNLSGYNSDVSRLLEEETGEAVDNETDFMRQDKTEKTGVNGFQLTN